MNKKEIPTDKNICNIIRSGSTGNAIKYFDTVLADCGVPFKLMKPYIYNINLLLLSHLHLDHFNYSTIKRLTDERPTLRIGCGEWMVPLLKGIKNIDVYEAGELYDYGDFQISPVKLYHDIGVPNFGYRLFKDGYKIIHCTDTCTLKGITAKNYDLFCLEHNYDEDTIWQIINDQEAKSEFAHQRRSMTTHLSFQQAQDFFIQNKKKDSKLIRLHGGTI